MTETETDATTETAASTETERTETRSETAGEIRPTTPDTSRIRRYLNYAILGGFGLLAAIAAVQFYLHAGSTIERWVAPAYRSLFQAIFNLVVLLVAGIGIHRQLRRLGVENGSDDSAGESNGSGESDDESTGSDESTSEGEPREEDGEPAENRRDDSVDS